MFGFLKRRWLGSLVDPEQQTLDQLLATPDSLLAHLQWGREGEGEDSLNERLVQWAAKVIPAYGYGAVTQTAGYLAPNLIVDSAGGPVVVLVLASFKWRNNLIPSSCYVDVVNAVKRMQRLPGRPERFILATTYEVDHQMQEVLVNQLELRACHLDLAGSAAAARARLAAAVADALISLCTPLPPVGAGQEDLFRSVAVVRPGFSSLHERLQRAIIDDLLRAIDAELT